MRGPRLSSSDTDSHTERSLRIALNLAYSMVDSRPICLLRLEDVGASEAVEHHRRLGEQIGKGDPPYTGSSPRGLSRASVLRGLEML
jgi:hypothetical protein